MIYNINGNVLSSDGGNTLPPFPLFYETTLVKHRGGNSASVFATAYNDGYRAVEGDVRFTSDSVPIMCHDSTLNGYTVANYTLAELEELTTVYTLDDWLTDCKKYNVLAEVDFTKTYTETQCGILVQHLVDNSMISRACIECYPATSALRLIDISTDLILSIFGNTSTSAIDSLASFEGKCKQIVCVIPHDNATKALVAYAHSKQYLVRIWTGSANANDTVAQAKEYLDMGADQVMTDNCKPSDIVPT